MKRHISFWVLFLLLVAACHKDGYVGPRSTIGSNTGNNRNQQNRDSLQPQGGKVYIVNEGNFQSANGSITSYDPISGKVESSVFEKENGFPLGDIPQSMTFFNGDGYIVVNNSNKVEVVESGNLGSIGTITGFNSPRYFLGVNANKGYVSDLYDDSLAIIDLGNQTISGKLAMGGWTEQMVLLNNEVFVANMGKAQLWIVDAVNDTIKDSIAVTKGPNSLRLDASGKLWVLCDGGINEDNPALLRIDPTTRLIELTMTFAAISESPNRLDMDPDGEYLYFLNKDVYRMSITANALPSKPFIKANGKLFYGLAIHPDNGEVYVTDAVDYVQQGRVLLFNGSNGSLIDYFNAGIIPGEFAFP